MLANALCYKLIIIETLIKKIINLVYIRQDSRDTVGPYSPFVTYYTVPAKRMEIDQLLRDDKENSVIPGDEIDCINAGMDDKTLGCTHCWTVHREGVEFCRNCIPIRQVDKVDTRIFDVILKLNQKGYPTYACCSGHATNSYGAAYFGMSMVIEPENVPEGFSVQVKDGRSIYQSMIYGKRNAKKGQRSSLIWKEARLEGTLKSICEA